MFISKSIIIQCIFEVLVFRNQAARQVNDSSQADSTNHAAGSNQQTSESLQSEVCAKFTALMTIFSSDVKLEGDFLREFQVIYL